MIDYTNHSPQEHVVIEDRQVNPSDIRALANVHSVQLINCTSTKWEYVADALAEQSNLHSLTLRNCDVDDSVCTGLAKSSSLRCLRIGINAKMQSNVR